MPTLDGTWNAFKNVAIVFSFVMNLILLVAVLLLVRFGLLVKNDIAEPMVDGLHGSFMAMDEATIQATIPVSTNVPVSFPLPIDNTPGTVVITEPTPLTAPATFTFPANGGQINGTVRLTLPQGMTLPVAVTLTVPVQTEVPIVLDVPASIPLNQTELHVPFTDLRYLLEPYVEALDDSPDTWAQVLNPASKPPEPPADATVITEE